MCDARFQDALLVSVYPTACDQSGAFWPHVCLKVVILRKLF